MKHIKTPFFSTLALTFVSTLVGCSQMMSEHKAMGDPDLTFIRNASYMQQSEIAAAELALHKSSNSDVKQFAQMMITDHSKAYEKLEKIAAAKNIEVPDMADPTHQLMTAQLEAYGSPVFEKEYIAGQVADHAKVLEMLKAKSKGANDATLRDFANMQIPTAEHHLMMARDLQAKLMR